MSVGTGRLSVASRYIRLKARLRFLASCITMGIKQSSRSVRKQVRSLASIRGNTGRKIVFFAGNRVARLYAGNRVSRLK